MAKTHEYVVILAGGGGTRLWPKSRTKTPKQFLKLVNNKTLFQETFNRIRNSFPIENIYVVTGKDFASETKRQIPEILNQNILSEPHPKNTTAAAGLAASYINKKDPLAIISTLAADHFIKERAKFLKILSISQRAAGKGDYLVTIGIRPTHADTGLGYIHSDGEAFKIGKNPVFKVSSFKEKPDITTAQAYYASREFFWNANINTYKAKTLLKAIDRYLPRLSKVLKEMGEEDNKNVDIQEKWKSLPSLPIDTAILEKAKNVLMIPGDIYWFDIGDWSSLHSVISVGRRDNVLVGDATEHVHLSTNGCLIHGNGRLIATIGVEDLLIIDTDDVLLICQNKSAQSVKLIVEKLARKNKRKYL